MLKKFFFDQEPVAEWSEAQLSRQRN